MNLFIFYMTVQVSDHGERKFHGLVSAADGQEARTRLTELAEQGVESRIVVLRIKGVHSKALCMEELP